MLTVRAPASSANLGPGYDCLSLALDLANVVHAEPAAETTVTVTGHGADRLPRDASNEIVRAAEAVFNARGRAAPTMRLTCENAIPPARGLGSSSAARASGLLLGNRLLPDPLSADELLSLGAELEGHPDNIAACLLGGVQVCVSTESRVEHCTVIPTLDLTTVVFVPDVPMATEEARAVLPRQISVETAVFNMGRAALLVAALAEGRGDLLRTATEDAIHQPPRGKIFPPMRALIEAALEAGALGAFLSGAGSSIMALVRPEAATAVEAGFVAVARRASVGGSPLRANIDIRGAEVSGSW
ncbi:MAG: homoserine kinase [Chloroflexota bacterium]